MSIRLPAGYVRHPELGTPMPPGSWKLKHTKAEVELVAKAVHHQADLTDADREQLLLLSGPLIGKALGAPSSVTDAERRQIIGWPPSEQCAANIAAVGLGTMRPEDIVAEIVKDRSWLKTREQAHLVANRFNLLPLDAPKLKRPTDSDGFGAEFLVRTDAEFSAYILAEAQFMTLSGTHPTQLLEKRKREDAENFEKAEQEREEKRAARKAQDEREAADPVYQERKRAARLLSLTKFADALHERVKNVIRAERPFGFCIYRTNEIEPLLAAFMSKGGIPDDPAWHFMRDFGEFWDHFVQDAVFGRDGELFQIWHRRQRTFDPHPAHPFMRWRCGALEAGPDDGVAYRDDFRLQREKWAADGISQRYFLVLSKEGFPPVKCVELSNRVAYAWVWVYDAEWVPPPAADGEDGELRDPDGYQGRLKVRYAYHTYLDFYPLTLEDGFDLKRLWMELADKEDVYPFPGSEIRKKVPVPVPCNEDGQPEQPYVMTRYVIGFAKEKGSSSS